MRIRLALALLAAGLAGAPVVSAQDAGPAFAPSLPEAVGDVSGWERITGDFETANARGSYWLYVNPASPAMYQLVRYRVELKPEGTRGQAPRRRRP